jgi:hypothetical protein
MPPMQIHLDWEPPAATLGDRVISYLTMAATAMSHGWCLVTCGHERYKNCQPHRITMKCVRCGSETTGWDLILRR